MVPLFCVENVLGSPDGPFQPSAMGDISLVDTVGLFDH